MAASRATGAPLIPKQRAQQWKDKEVVPTKSKGKGGGSRQPKSKRKTMESLAHRAPKKKLLASAKQVTE